MSDGPRPDLAARKAAVLARQRFDALAEAEGLKLSGARGGAQFRARCPFHLGKSASFAVVSKGGAWFGHCFGCQWHGNAIDFLAALRGIAWLDALSELEARLGLADQGSTAAGSGPVQRERNPAAPRRTPRWDPVAPIEMGRWIWQAARRDDGAARRYFEGRGIPPGVLGAARLSAFRYLGECPAALWAQGADPRRTIHNPALVALVVAPRLLGDPAVLEFVAVGVIVTYLSPDGAATMVRRKPWAKPGDPDPWLPKRRMLGPVGHGAVILGEWHAEAALWVGEGSETVLSALALAGAPDDAVGVATLSLDNLQGFANKWQGGIWPLHRIEPDPERPCFTIPGQRGPVTVLVDADMSPLQRQKVVERVPGSKRAGPIVERALTGAERAAICGTLAVKGWRRSGAPEVTALRPPAGMDFNDAVMSLGGARDERKGVAV